MEAHQFMARDVLSIDPQSSIREAYELMQRSAGARHLPVVVGERLVGMLSDRDVLPYTRDGAVVVERRVDEIMSLPPIVAGASTTAARLAERMLEYRIDAIPIVDGDRLVGLVTTSDLLLLLTTEVSSNGTE